MEDIKGSPFVGRAGKLLDRILEEEGVDRASLLITNTVKCRPPGNRDPTEEEMAACRPFLIDELRGREFVVALGRSACRSLAGINAPMKEIANKKMELDLGDEKLIFIPTYHPAACIYSKAARDALKETVRMIKGLL
ncbi:MAG: uracil-DNA glycosylase [Candidatus Methanomethylophilaceae archaeon]|nr:uracil-DNA glycosylase [Candidatus Methanomethylophilaceae archaeon]